MTVHHGTGKFPEKATIWGSETEKPEVWLGVSRRGGAAQAIVDCKAQACLRHWGKGNSASRASKTVRLTQKGKQAGSSLDQIASL